MHAVVMREFGPPSVLRLEAVPEPEGEVVVDIVYASAADAAIEARATVGTTLLDCRPPAAPRRGQTPRRN
jgi:hypothetical protein